MKSLFILMLICTTSAFSKENFNLINKRKQIDAKSTKDKFKIIDVKRDDDSPIGKYDPTHKHKKNLTFNNGMDFFMDHEDIKLYCKLKEKGVDSNKCLDKHILNIKKFYNKNDYGYLISCTEYYNKTVNFTCVKSYINIINKRATPKKKVKKLK